MAAPEDYFSKIAAEHSQRPRFMATVALSVQPYVDGINAANSLIGLFDLDSAVGEQLDFLGQWVGVSRYIAVETHKWFTLDEHHYDLGLDQGLWLTPYDTASELVPLDDSQYRALLHGRIIANQWDGTIPGLYEAWNAVFYGTGYQVLIQDGMTRAETDFTLDFMGRGLDQSLWYEVPKLDTLIYFSLDSTDPAQGLDQGLLLGPPGSEILLPVARTNGNMHLIEALLGPPVDPLTQALFTGDYLGLKSAGVGVDYYRQNQGPAAGHPPDGTSGIGLPLFCLDAQAERSYWLSLDTAGAGVDQAPFFYPGGVPGDPVPPVDVPAPPTGVQFPPNAVAGLDYGAWAEHITPAS